MFRIVMLTVVVCLVAADQSRLEVRSLGEVKRAVFSDGSVDRLGDNYGKVCSGEIMWCTAVYQGKKIIKDGATGEEYSTLLEQFETGNRVYAYVGMEYGDERKFAFITWIGPSVSPLKKAKVSTDKAFVKTIFSEFNKEILADDFSEVSESKVRAELMKPGSTKT